MADMIHRGLGWLTDKLAAHAAVSCTLTPAQSPPIAVLTVRATMGRCQVEAPDAGGSVVLVQAQVAFIPAIDLCGYEPRNGDRLSGPGIDYEVAAPCHGASSWTWGDGFKTRMRIFLRERNGERPTG